jgi:hypothetical protein
MDHPLFLATVIATFVLFGCVLGFASFEESRARRRKALKPQAAAPKREAVSGNVIGFAK